MNQKKFIEYCDQVVAEGQKTTIGRVTDPSHELGALALVLGAQRNRRELGAAW